LTELGGNTALDASALIEYLTGTPLGKILREYFRTLSPDQTVTISIFTLAETFYVLCRKKGEAFASQTIAEILSSQIVDILNSPDLAVDSGKLKCGRAISLAGCSCLVTAKYAKAKAVFAFKENELLREMKRRSLGIDVVFLEDLASNSGK
jgi:predicted nucleic acid-binding protein